MAERLLDLVVTRAEYHLSCAVLWAQILGKERWQSCLPINAVPTRGTAWFAAAEIGRAQHTLGNTHTSSVRPNQHKACWHTPLPSTIHTRKLGHSAAAEVRGTQPQG